MNNINFVNFKDYANSKLRIIKEQKTATYDKFVMSNFGRLKESLSIEKLQSISDKSKIFTGASQIVRKAIYKDIQYPYVMYNESICIGIDEKGLIIYIDDFYSSLLSSGEVLNK